jgi:hypothetical protein
MQSPFEARQLAAPDALSAVAAYVNREYGSFGYSIGIAHTYPRVAVFEVRHADGSTFNLVADCWGNVKRPDDASLEGVAQLAREVYENAVAI